MITLVTVKVWELLPVLPVFPSDVCFLADFLSSPEVALKVLYVPSTSMSMTDLKALAESCSIGARKLPAAPALGRISIDSLLTDTDVHHKVNVAQLGHASLHRLCEALRAANVDTT